MNMKELAKELIDLSRNTIIMNMRFMDTVFTKFKIELSEGQSGHFHDGLNLFVVPKKLLTEFKADQGYCNHLVIHGLLHTLFFHGVQLENKDKRLWDLSCDIAVEAVILDLNLSIFKTKKDDELETKLRVLRKKVSPLSAQKLYKYFLLEEPSAELYESLTELTKYDNHIVLEVNEETEYDLNELKKLAERIKADLKSFSKGQVDSEAFMESIKEATKEKFDYSEFLRKFTATGETVKVNDDEFDYIYYTYGLKVYGNLPLIEPLEYKDDKKIKDFVIAIDTSASTKGELLQTFLNKTVTMVKSRESFFDRFNLHIIQCDSEVRSDYIINEEADLEVFLKEGMLSGGGSTDFRPVFEYVEELKQEGKFSNLKGLIYFTDGYGIYPEKMPDYQVAFIFTDDDDNRPKVPAFAMSYIYEDFV